MERWPSVINISNQHKSWQISVNFKYKKSCTQRKFYWVIKSNKITTEDEHILITRIISPPDATLIIQPFEFCLMFHSILQSLWSVVTIKITLLTFIRRLSNSAAVPVLLIEQLSPIVRMRVNKKGRKLHVILIKFSIHLCKIPACTDSERSACKSLS